MLKRDKGGYVADEHSLSQDGTCWVYDNGYIGCKAQVKDDALIKSALRFQTSLLLKNKAIIDKHGIVLNSAIIQDNAIVVKFSMISISCEVKIQIQHSQCGYSWCLDLTIFAKPHFIERSYFNIGMLSFMGS